MKLENVLKKYDYLLFSKKRLDGKIEIYRKSPFSTNREFKLMEITNQYLGSYKWIIRELIKMDTTRNDIVRQVLENNRKIQKKEDNNAMTRDIVDFIDRAGMTVNL